MRSQAQYNFTYIEPILCIKLSILMWLSSSFSCRLAAQDLGVLGVPSFLIVFCAILVQFFVCEVRWWCLPRLSLLASSSSSSPHPPEDMSPALRSSDIPLNPPLPHRTPTLISRSVSMDESEVCLLFRWAPPEDATGIPLIFGVTTCGHFVLWTDVPVREEVEGVMVASPLCVMFISRSSGV